LSATPNASPSDLASSDILTGKKLETPANRTAFSQLLDASTPEREAKINTLPVGVFQVGASGQVSADYVFDGGYYKGELAVFSLTGMENLIPGSKPFIRELGRNPVL
jgi:hypothetical protein